jgi:hypothetical protein
MPSLINAFKDISLKYLVIPHTQDVGLLDLDDFRYGGTNVTAFRLVNPSSPLVAETLSDWKFDLKLTGTSPLANDLGFSVGILLSTNRSLFQNNLFNSSLLASECLFEWCLHGMSLFSVVMLLCLLCSARSETTT